MPLAKNKIRNAHKSVCNEDKKTVSKTVNDFLKEFDTSLLSNTKKLKGWKLTLNEKKNTIMNLDEAVLNNIGPDKMDEEINEASEFSENINRVIAKIDVAMETIKKETTEANTVGTNHLLFLVTMNVESAPAANLQAKLPRLTLGRFSSWIPQSGNLSEIAVHSNKSISSVDKYNYLKELLDGTTASTIDLNFGKL